MFHHSVRDGTILRIICTLLKEGKTSATYSVEVIDEKATPHPIFTTRVTFVSVDDAGKKRPIRS
ncbi:MAG: hypothetical protein H8M99_05430 [Gloeobacteraceae cyanobacterium ES-bin-144]|nr:hypothetical protein [Verrucomicrobiales bacterium]